jgi:putative glutamine amidotransferase
MDLLIGITQRVITDPDYGERRDALDQAWAGFLAAAGLQPVPIPNRLSDAGAYARRLGVQGLILTGGNNISAALTTVHGEAMDDLPAMTGTAPERDSTEAALLGASIAAGWPVLGVCRGLQVLNLFHGGGISPAKNHVATTHGITPSAQAPAGLATPVFSETVNSYHDYGITTDQLAPDLCPWARAGDGTLEAAFHRRLPHYGIMWHPEREAVPRPCDIGLFQAVFAATAH